MNDQDAMAAAATLIGRNAPPSHYSIKIESFSLLKASVKKCLSDEFDAGDYKWKLCIYPSGNESKNGKEHISIYLELMETSSLSVGWEVNVIAKFFVFNHLQNQYFSCKDWLENRCHSMNTRFGIAKFMDLNTFSNPVNGYLIDDTCVFGVEVFVVKNTFKGRCLSMINDPTTCFYTWHVSKFSTLVEEKYVSDSFGYYNWNILLYPHGNGRGKGSSISMFLYMSQSIIPSDTKLVVNFIVRVKDQKNENHVEFEDTHLFASNNSDWGSSEFLSLAKLKDLKDSYLVNDTLIIEAEVKLLGSVLAKS